MRKSVLLLAFLVPAALVAEREVTPFLGCRGGTFKFTSGVGCIGVVGVECSRVRWTPRRSRPAWPPASWST